MAFDQTFGLSTPEGGLTDGKITFPITRFGDQYQQDSFGANTMTMQFQVIDPNTGLPISGLKSADLLVKENTVNVGNFNLEATDNNSGRRADIVFVIDVTGSMQPYIDQVKMKVADFVNDLAKTNIKASLCLVTFADDLGQKCDRFVEDDARTPNNENVQWFLDELSKISSGGGGDLPENQLAALEAATMAPWHKDAQRLAILVTDAPFHYAPDFLGDASSAPEYAHTLKALQTTRMQTFIIGPQFTPGYSLDFTAAKKTYPALPVASGGKWFDLSEILNGTMGMGEVFDAIIDQINTIYKLTYVIDDIPGLDPALPEARRNVVINLRNTSLSATFQMLSLSTTFPSGHAHYKFQFEISSEDYRADSLKVGVNGKYLTTGWRADGRLIFFDKAPAAGATIRIEYYRAKLRDNLRLQPIVLTAPSIPTKLRIIANGVVLQPSQYKITQVEKQKFMIELSESLFTEDDPLHIRDMGGVTVEVKTK